MVILVSDKNITFQCLDLLLSLFSESILMSWKVVLWFILDINHINRFGLLPTWLILLQIQLRKTIILIVTVSYEGTLVYFCCVNSLWVNDAHILW